MDLSRRGYIGLIIVGCLQMADVLNNVYSDVIDELRIIDCRYPYEYEGGHIPVSFASLYLAL